jgi:hypothetical protein
MILVTHIPKLPGKTDGVTQVGKMRDLWMELAELPASKSHSTSLGQTGRKEGRRLARCPHGR